MRAQLQCEAHGVVQWSMGCDLCVMSLRERLEAAERERDNAQQQLELRNRAFTAWFAVAMQRDADLREALARIADCGSECLASNGCHTVAANALAPIGELAKLAADQVLQALKVGVGGRSSA